MTTPRYRPLMEGKLWEWAASTAASALASGALVPLTTNCVTLATPLTMLVASGLEKSKSNGTLQGSDASALQLPQARSPLLSQSSTSSLSSEQSGGLPSGPSLVIPIRILERVERKENANKDKPTGFNPFLPPEPELTVCEVGDDHLVVLNKFNVFDRHLLLISRDFVHQVWPLTQEDFTAASVIMREGPAFMFYNSHREAGGSQPHRHIQFVPLPLYQHSDTPLDPLLAEDIHDNIQPAFPFVHRFMWLTPQDWSDPSRLLDIYQRFMAELNLLGTDHETQPYNILATAKWFMMIPRRKEGYHGIELNGLGYSGCMLVKSAALVDDISRVGVLQIMLDCGFPREGIQLRTTETEGAMDAVQILCVLADIHQLAGCSVLHMT